MKRRIFIKTMACLLLICAGCQSISNKSQENTIYTSIYPIQFITDQIVGDTATVLSVYPPGVDAHSFEPTTKTITDIATSEAFIYLGAGMEGFSESTSAALQSTDVTFIEIGLHESLFLQTHDDHHGHDHGDFDPHIWFDPLRMQAMAEIIAEQLIDRSPEYASLYQANLNHLIDDLQALDEAFTDVLDSKENKEIVVTHAAYGYWEDRYGIKQIPISGLNASSEPSQKTLVNIVKTAQAHNIQHVLFEQNTSNHVAKVIQQYIGADVLYIHNLEVLTDQDIANGEDYFSLMKQNLETLDQATD